jgi:type I restriction enzyme M protein
VFTTHLHPISGNGPNSSLQIDLRPSRAPNLARPRVAVVVPHGVLFRSGAESKIRQKVIEENLLDAVIGLPANLFQSTSISVAILIFDRRRESGGPLAKRKDVLFIDASQEFQQAKTQNMLLEEQITKIVDTFRERKIIDKYSRSVPTEEIAENNFNLNIPRYIDTFVAEDEVNIVAVQAEIDVLEAELVQVKEKMKDYLKDLGLNV